MGRTLQPGAVGRQTLEPNGSGCDGHRRPATKSASALGKHRVLAMVGTSSKRSFWDSLRSLQAQCEAPRCHGGSGLLSPAGQPRCGQVVEPGRSWKPWRWPGTGWGSAGPGWGRAPTNSSWVQPSSDLCTRSTRRTGGPGGSCSCLVEARPSASTPCSLASWSGSAQGDRGTGLHAAGPPASHRRRAGAAGRTCAGHSVDDRPEPEGRPGEGPGCRSSCYRHGWHRGEGPGRPGRREVGPCRAWPADGSRAHWSGRGLLLQLVGGW